MVRLVGPSSTPRYTLPSTVLSAGVYAPRIALPSPSVPERCVCPADPDCLSGNPALLPEHVDVLVAMRDPALARELARDQRLISAQTNLLAKSGQHDILLALIESGNLAMEWIPGDDPWALLAAVNRVDAPDDFAA